MNQETQFQSKDKRQVVTGWKRHSPEEVLRANIRRENSLVELKVLTLSDPHFPTFKNISGECRCVHDNTQKCGQGDLPHIQQGALKGGQWFLGSFSPSAHVSFVILLCLKTIFQEIDLKRQRLLH